LLGESVHENEARHIDEAISELEYYLGYNVWLIRVK
jgi:hypothetical protein